ncbi:MAG: SDR family oxidoreductase [Nitrospinae bacterium]|nr:SDR family oxidoreductase [Nitrospinota bacterium]
MASGRIDLNSNAAFLKDLSGFLHLICQILSRSIPKLFYQINMSHNIIHTRLSALAQKLIIIPINLINVFFIPLFTFIGIIKTPIHGLKDEEFEALDGMQPLGRVGEVKDIVDAVLYLADANFVTGVVLPVDGGVAAGGE